MEERLGDEISQSALVGLPNGKRGAAGSPSVDERHESPSQQAFSERSLQGRDASAAGASCARAVKRESMHARALWRAAGRWAVRPGRPRDPRADPTDRGANSQGGRWTVVEDRAEVGGARAARRAEEKGVAGVRRAHPGASERAGRGFRGGGCCLEQRTLGQNRCNGMPSFIDHRETCLRVGSVIFYLGDGADVYLCDELPRDCRSPLSTAHRNFFLWGPRKTSLRWTEENDTGGGGGARPWPKSTKHDSAPTGGGGGGPGR